MAERAGDAEERGGDDVGLRASFLPVKHILSRSEVRLRCMAISLNSQSNGIEERELWQRPMFKLVSNR